MEKKTNLYEKISKISSTIHEHHTGAYAAQSAYFFMLSLIPIILLLMMFVRYTPIKMDDMLEAVLNIFPSSVEGFIRTIVWQVYNQSASVIPLTILIALWSSGKGVLSIMAGLNTIYKSTEKRNYFYRRFRASLCTVLFLLAIALSLILSVFGVSISLMLNKHMPFLRPVTDMVIRIRTVFTLAVLTLFWDLVYRFLPDQKCRERMTWREHLPGAFFTACGWQLLSFVFSIYLDVFTGFSSMYGSLTTIILIMLWLYMCMYVILLGGEVNVIWGRKC